MSFLFRSQSTPPPGEEITALETKQTAEWVEAEPIFGEICQFHPIKLPTDDSPSIGSFSEITFYEVTAVPYHYQQNSEGQALGLLKTKSALGITED